MHRTIKSRVVALKKQQGSLAVEYAVIGAVIVSLWAIAINEIVPAFAEYQERYGWAISMPL